VILSLRDSAIESAKPKSQHQGVADLSPAAVPTPVGAPGAGSGFAGISTEFDEPPQPETAAADNMPAMTIHLK